MRISFLNEAIKENHGPHIGKEQQSIKPVQDSKIELKQQSIEITDIFRKIAKTQLAGLSQGFKFTSIHMASARYFSPAQAYPPVTQILDHSELNNKGTLTSRQQIFFSKSPDDRSK